MPPVWTEFGRLPALFVVSAYFAVAAYVAFALDASSTPLVASVFVVLALYCIARPTDGMTVFLTAIAPAVGATLAENLLGAPRWVGFFLVPLALLVIHQIDVDPREEQPVTR